MASNNRTTKAERREAARAKAQAMREEQERKERRARLTRRAILGAGGLAIVGVGGAMYLDSRGRVRLEGGTIVSEKAGTSGVPGPVLADGSWTFGGSLKPGSVASDATIVEVFFDYACHFCAYFENLHHKELKSLVENGDITLVLRPSKFLGSDWTNLTMNSIGVVLDKQPDAAFAFHAALMSLFARIFDTKNTSLATVESIVSSATQAGVSTDVSAEFEAAVNEGRYSSWVTLGTDTLDKYNIKGTPTVLVAGKQVDLKKVGTENGLTDLIRSGGVKD